MGETCDLRFRVFGLDEYDITWVFHLIIEKMPFDDIIALFWKWFNIITTPGALEEKIISFNLMDAFKGNKFNPFAWFATWFDGFIYRKSTFIGTDSPPDDIFNEIFGSELYGIFYSHLIYTLKPFIAEIKWRLANGVDLSWLPDWLQPYLTIPEIDTLMMWFIGFKPECIGVQMGMYAKLIQVILLIPAWIFYIFLFIIRFISLVIYWIIFFVFGI